MVGLPHHRHPLRLRDVWDVIAIIVVVALLALLVATCANSFVPQQAQASHLAVPAQSETKYAGAIVVTQCREALAVLFVSKDGEIYPQHFSRDLTFQQLLKNLTDAPADKIIEVDLACPTD